MEWPISIRAIAVAVVSSIGVGLCSGFYPVAKAGALGGQEAPPGREASKWLRVDHFTPEMQQLLGRAIGTLPLSQHRAFGPCTPGCT